MRCRLVCGGVVLVVLALVLGGCSGGNGPFPDANSGSAVFSYAWSALLGGKAQTRGTVVKSLVISIGGKSRTLQEPATSLTVDQLPAGYSTYTVTAFDNIGGFGNTLGVATGMVHIIAGQSTGVTIAAMFNAPTQVIIGNPAGSANLAIGDTLTLTAVAATASGDVVLLPANSFTWSSANPGVAKVGADGTVTALSTGQATITATYPNSGVPLSKTCTLQVGGSAPAVQERIALSSTRDGNYQLYLANPDGSNLTRVITSTTTDTAPALEGHSGQLAFASYRNSNWDLYLVNPNGSGLRRLTTGAQAEFAPAWSPDGQTIACDVWQTGSTDATQQGAPTLQNLQGIALVDVASGTQQMLLTNASSPCWSPDGTQLVFTDWTRGRCLSVINVQSKVVTQLTVLPTSDMEDIHPVWSPDGTRIAFERRADTLQFSTLYTVATTGLHPITQLTTGGKEHLPCWSPDGTSLAFAAEHDNTLETYLMPATPNAAPRQLLTGTSLNVANAWGRW